MIQVHFGRLNIALAVSSQQRNAQIPSVPTVAESGFPGFEVGTGFFIMIPAKTPKNVVKEVEDNFQRALSEPAIQDRIRKLGIEPALKMTMEDASMWLDVERAKWSRLILEKNIKAE